MCEVVGPSRVNVCDVAVGRYRQALTARLGAAVSFTNIERQPTLVECRDGDRLEEFQTLVQELMKEPS